MPATQKFTPFLWFNSEAAAAAALYARAVPRSRVVDSQTLENTPSGTVEILTVRVNGMDLRVMSAGPEFKINPSISFFIRCATEKEVDASWQALSAGGTPLMELGEYPFSRRYGWIQDRFGVSWQVGIFDPSKLPQETMPSLLFVGKVSGKAEEAMKFYASIFSGSSIGAVERYTAGEGPDAPGTIKFASFSLAGQ